MCVCVIMRGGSILYVHIWLVAQDIFLCHFCLYLIIILIMKFIDLFHFQ